MHRSGTSALTRVFSLLGCSLPQTLLPAAPDNVRGFWESAAICNLNDEILSSAGWRWDDWEPFDSSWYHSPIAAEFHGRAYSILASEFGTSRLFVLKDPRICRLLPFWIKVLNAFGVTPFVVCPIRNPLEVAASLEARNKIDVSTGMLIWLRYVLDAEAASRSHQRIFLRYEDLLENWQEVTARLDRHLAIDWLDAVFRAEPEIGEFLAPVLRHHVHRDSNVADNSCLSVWVRESFEILSRWSQDDVRAGDKAALNRIRAAFNKAAPAFGRPLAAGREAARRASQLEGDVAHLIAKLQTRDAEIIELEAKLQAQEERVIDFKTTLETRDAEARELAAKLQAQEERVIEVKTTLEMRNAEVRELAAKLADRDHVIKGLKNSTSWRITAPLRLLRMVLLHVIGQLQRRLIRGIGVVYNRVMLPQPAKIRTKSSLFRLAAPLFRGIGRDERAWIPQAPPKIQNSAFAVQWKAIRSPGTNAPDHT